MASYVLILYNEFERELRVGKLGIINFNPGYYYYVGSAEKMSRLKRHFAKKTKRWHIDHISEVFTVLGAILVDIKECELAKKFKMKSIEKFGCSDCSCKSHLFYSENLTIEYLLT